MTLRSKISVYLIVVHVIFGAIALAAFLREPLALIPLELLLAVSLAIGLKMFRTLFVPLDLVRTGADLIGERDFTTHFVDVGQPEMDALILVYNRMIDRLREERLHLEENQIFLSRIISSSPSAIVTTDFNGAIEDVNDAFLSILQLERSDVSGKPLGEVNHPLAAALSGLEVGPPRVVNIMGRRLKCWHARFFDRGFERSFFLLDELTEELRASERSAYEKLIRMMSHEVSNSVGAVRSLLDSSVHYGSQLRTEDSEDFRQAVSVAQARLENLNRFVGAFAEVVRLPSPQRLPCDLQALATDLLVLIRPELEKRGIESELLVDEHVPLVSADKNQLEQVLVNVLKNAVESIGEQSGTISIRIGDDQGLTFISVTDSGSGISPELERNLFTPFFSTKRDGRGLGLTVVQEILYQHGFDFSLRNAPGGGGAEFRIAFREAGRPAMAASGRDVSEG